MRLVGPQLLGAFANRMLNIHPSLLPAFRGLEAQRQAFEYGVRVTGATVHVVTSELDGGPILFLSWFVIMLSVNLQTSFLTPPFGLTLFYMKGTVPPSVSMGHIYRGIVPFVALQLLGLLLVLAFPELALWLPRAAGFLS